MTESSAVVIVDKAEVQGNLAGFNQDHQRLLYITFPDAATGQAVLAALRPQLATAEDVLAVNKLYKRMVGERHASHLSVRATWVNILLSMPGLGKLGAEGLDQFPPEFRTSMGSQSGALGDTDRSDPGQWRAPFTGGAEVDALVIVAGDDISGTSLIDARLNEISTLIAGAGGVVVDQQAGDVRPDTQRGHEHFGFKDGISQPTVKGLTRSSKGGDQVPAGEFIIGYPDATGAISGEAGAVLPVPQPGELGYGQPQPPAPVGLPAWTKNGSFVVYRRLQQDVQGFQSSTQSAAATTALAAEAVGAKLVGRWASGAPMERVPGMATGVDPSLSDPSTADPTVLDDNRINNFEYQQHDADGLRVPRAAHIRKVYPRDQQPPGEADAERHRILRRGIPYGPEVVSGESAYPGSGAVPETQDRGLLFICYQASIANGFAFIQSQWVNAPDFPQAGDGVDPIISQQHDGATFTMPPHGPLTLSRWVITTGGGYFFSPSLSAVAELSGQASS